MPATLQNPAPPFLPLGRRVLVADDDPPICQTISAVLGAEGCEVDCAATLEVARHKLERQCDLLLLDLVFPDGDGFDLLSQLKQDQRRSLPVIVLSAITRQETKLRAFELGADDYIPKPFAPRELAARCLAVMRRCYANNVISFGPYRIDLTARQLHRGTVPIHLRPKEFDLLALLASRPGEAITREEMLSQVWSEKPNSAQQAVAVAVHALRDKLEEGLDKPRYIRTISRFGYRFDPGS